MLQLIYITVRFIMICFQDIQIKITIKCTKNIILPTTFDGLWCLMPLSTIFQLYCGSYIVTIQYNERTKRTIWFCKLRHNTEEYMERWSWEKNSRFCLPYTMLKRCGEVLREQDDGRFGLSYWYPEFNSLSWQIWSSINV